MNMCVKEGACRLRGAARRLSGAVACACVDRALDNEVARVGRGPIWICGRASSGGILTVSSGSQTAVVGRTHRASAAHGRRLMQICGGVDTGVVASEGVKRSCARREGGAKCAGVGPLTVGF